MLTAPTSSERWTDIIAADALPLFVGVASIFAPSIPGIYDPLTDTTIGGTPPLAIVTGSPARMKWIRYTKEASTPFDWDAVRAARIQIPRDAYTKVIPRGYFIRFTNGGDDPSLLNVAFTVLISSDSTESALRTIECVSTGANTPPVIP